MEIAFKEKEGSISWQSPSNIALVKYWGKKPKQIPMNSSLSFTLQDSVTIIQFNFRFASGNRKLKLKYLFENAENKMFSERIYHYLLEVQQYLPFISSLELEIHSKNTFPHSAGIASSSSAFSALAICLVDLEQALYDRQYSENDFLRKASFLARLGSGSACRSVFGGAAIWGRTAVFAVSSDEYAVPVMQKFNKVFHAFHDTILLLDTDPKSVSSSRGHSLMDNNPFAQTRFSSAHDNLMRLTHAMEQGDINRFIEITEYEALTLHAMMMTSWPGYLLLKPASLRVIDKVRSYRENTGVPVGFTIDAGANMHILYPEMAKTEVRIFIENDLRPLCVSGQLIHDRVGDGPKKLT